MVKLIISVLFFFLAGSIFFAYVRPTYANFDVIKAQIAQYDSALQKASQLEQLKQTLLQKYNAFNPQDINRLQTMLPDHADNIGLILELDSLAGHYGMALENADVSTDSGSSGQAASAIVPDGASPYQTIQLHFTTFGPYDKFQQFMHDLETSLRVVDLVSLKLSPQAGSGGYNYDITLKTYWLK